MRGFRICELSLRTGWMLGLVSMFDFGGGKVGWGFGFCVGSWEWGYGVFEERGGGGLPCADKRVRMQDCHCFELGLDFERY